MKYKVNHPSQDLARALGLEKSQELRLNNIIFKTFGEGNYGSADEIISVVAPYIKTSEEAFYAATAIFSSVEAAKHEVLRMGN